jgi:hypothetical protein
MHILGNGRGGSRIKVWLTFLVLFLAIHVGIKVVPMYMDYERMLDTMTVKAGVAQVLRDEEILRDLVSKARELDLPLNADSFILERNEERRKMAIRTKHGWDVEVTFLWGAYTRDFHFEPSVEENIMTVLR